LAVPAIHAFGGLPASGDIGVCASLAICHAHPTVVAGFFIARDLHQRIFSDDSEKCAQRTDEAAPETRTIEIQKQHAENSSARRTVPVKCGCAVANTWRRRTS